ICLDDAATVARLKEYYGVVARSVESHGGVIDKVMGDGVLAHFNAVSDCPEHRTESRACAAEIAEQVSIIKVNGKNLTVAVAVGSGGAEVAEFHAGTHHAVTVIGGMVNRVGMALRKCKAGVIDADKPA
ncbi:hypothetical protein K8R78_06005, partial [bacterium]|nr:hypothetical protein [bacterium]